MRVSIIILAICAVGSAYAQDADDNKITMERVLVTGLKPVAAEAEPGGQILSKDPGVSVPSIGEWLKSSVAGVTFSEPLGNPFQIELSYRGYGVSGLLGLPQGLAFYQNGSRINEAFGDAVHFDIFPDMAVDKLTVVSGANPLFGLNALGGAVAATMKNGFTYDNGTKNINWRNRQIEAYGGSFGRAHVAAQSGNVFLDDSLAIYNAISYSYDRGWRDHSPSRVLRTYSDLAWRFERGDVGLSFTSASLGLMTGNAAAPEELLAVRRQSVFTWPDETRNGLLFLQGRGNYLFTEWLEISGSFHWRRLRQDTLNGDESDAEECEDHIGFLCLEDDDDDDERAMNADGEPIRLSDVTDDDDAEFGMLNTSSTRSNSGGFDIQFTAQPPLPMLREAVLGVGYNRGVSTFVNFAEIGVMNDDRSVSGSGVKLGAEDPDEDEFHTDLKTTNSTVSVFGGLALAAPDDAFGLEVSGRYDGVTIDMDDRYGEALDGNHVYRRFNPAVELTVTPPLPTPGEVELFARYAESSRSPSPAELACADPENPCRFPNAFLSDPPLKQVVTRGGEFGATLRHDLGGGELAASLTGYYNINHDDILFISSDKLIGSGYFANVDRTRRAGMEMLAQWQNEAFSLRASYAWIDARFQSNFDIFSANHPDAEDGEISVGSGDRLPLIPVHSGFIGGEWRPLRTDIMEAGIGLDLYMASDRFLRGDENNSADKLNGFVRLDFNIDFTLIAPNSKRRILIFLRGENIANAKYATFGAFGEPGSVALSELGEGNEENYGARFVTPSAPVAIFAGVKLIR